MFTPLKLLNYLIDYLSSNNYFNAGVIVINYRFWKSQGLGQKLLNAMDEICEKVNFWDQDILNYVIDGNYLSISNNLNFLLL